jgi:hypothetical protein
MLLVAAPAGSGLQKWHGCDADHSDDHDEQVFVVSSWFDRPVQAALPAQANQADSRFTGRKPGRAGDGLTGWPQRD